MVAFTVISYVEKILFDTVSRYDNFIKALIITGVVYVIQLLVDLPKKR
jgi:hypothetical protein